MYTGQRTGIGLGHTVRCTTLIEPPQAAAIKAEHHDELEIDAVDLLPALTGHALHLRLEACGQPYHTEIGLAASLNGWRVTGTADHLYRGTLTDYKTCKMLKIQKKDYTDWERQLNVYGWLAREIGYEVNTVQIEAYMTDWTRNGGIRAGLNTPVITIQLPLWEKSQAEAWIASRLKDLEQALEGNPRPCTDAERWYSQSVWAVTKPGRKSAFKLCSTESEARRVADSIKGGDIEHRGGLYRRCENWCSAAPWCTQWQA